MRWDFMQLIMLLLMAYSQFEMVHFAYLRKKGNFESFFCFYKSYSIIDYIKLTREEKGRIGGWFWLFVFSAIVFVVVVVNGMVLESEFGDSLRMNRDDVWIVL